VHGCASELETLLKTAEVTKEDDLIIVGDLICKGPDSRSVMQWAMSTPNLRCVLGNHEARLLGRWIAGDVLDPSTSDDDTTRQLSDCFEESMNFIKSWPLAAEDDGFLVVHAGIDPRIPTLAQQLRHDLLNIRTLEGTDIPWYEAYTEERLIVFGHWARRDPIIRPNAIGLDSGCVYGGALTALILPERRLVSIPAAKEYQTHAALK
jgi:serine/threonine protein phosphatase 1